jgi:hypothetical protein
MNLLKPRRQQHRFVMGNHMNKILYIFILTLITFSCNRISDKRNIERLESSKFYKDYNIFTRQGIDLIDKNNLTLPFIQEYDRNDSLIIIRIYTEDFDSFLYMVLPVNDGYVFKSSFSPLECSGMYFIKIDSNKIIRYNYQDIPYELIKNETDSMSLYQIVPFSIEVITKDYIKFILYQNYIEDKYNVDINERGKLSKMKDKFVLPFNAKIDLNGGFETYGDNLYLTKIIEMTNGYYGLQYVMDTGDSANAQTFNKGRIRFDHYDYYPKQFKIWRPYLKLI